MDAELMGKELICPEQQVNVVYWTSVGRCENTWLSVFPSLFHRVIKTSKGFTCIPVMCTWRSACAQESSALYQKVCLFLHLLLSADRKTSHDCKVKV